MVRKRLCLPSFLINIKKMATNLVKIDINSVTYHDLTDVNAYDYMLLLLLKAAKTFMRILCTHVMYFLISCHVALCFILILVSSLYFWLNCFFWFYIQLGFKQLMLNKGLISVLKYHEIDVGFTQIKLMRNQQWSKQTRKWLKWL